jgi:Ca2+-binding RTX toxin-like protein
VIRRAATVLALTAGVAATLPSAAPAATAGFFNNTLIFTAAPGETNNVLVSGSGGNTYTITDTGAAITPGASCVAVNANQVSCTSINIVSIRVTLANGNDEVRFDGSVDLPSTGSESAIADGGEGNDTLTGAPNERNQLFGDDFLSATPGDDVLTGGARGDSFFPGGGTDRASGGAGEDMFSTDEQDGPDVYSGGPDVDTFSASGFRPQGISVDGQANDGVGCPGAGCEGDNVGADIENVFSGQGDDVVTGSPASNVILTSSGDDRILAGGGADVAVAGDGQDQLDGGAGPDRLFPEDGEDRASGAAGDDTLFSVTTDDEPDVLIGGRGTDVVDYSEASGPVRVDLDGRPDDGVESENDNVRADIEDAIGTRFADVLVGSRGANELSGGDGDDRVFGGAGSDGLLGERGDDLLVLGPGTDLADGGAGVDRFRSRDKSRDQIRCGSSVDRVKADRRDRTTVDCDKVSKR